MSGGRSQPPQSVGDVLAMLAQSLRAERERGLGHLAPEVVERIERVVGAAQEQGGERRRAMPMGDAQRVGPADTAHLAQALGDVSGELERKRASSDESRVPPPSARGQEGAREAQPAVRTDEAAFLPWAVDENNDAARRESDARRRNMAEASARGSAPPPRAHERAPDAAPWADEERAHEPAVKPRLVAEPAGPAASLGEAHARVSACTRCRLSSGRKNAVPGEGRAPTRLMFVGEGPGVIDDGEGRPFQGESGELLGKMIQAMGLRREDVYITNIVKCVTPEKRAPHDDELAACTRHLRDEIALVRPEVIVALGKDATLWFLGQGVKFSSVRGRMQRMQDFSLMPTYHPTYLLHQQTAKRDAWADLQEVMRHLGLPPAR